VTLVVYFRPTPSLAFVDETQLDAVIDTSSFNPLIRLINRTPPPL